MLLITCVTAESCLDFPALWHFCIVQACADSGIEIAWIKKKISRLLFTTATICPPPKEVVTILYQVLLSSDLSQISHLRENWFWWFWLFRQDKKLLWSKNWRGVKNLQELQPSPCMQKTALTIGNREFLKGILIDVGTPDHDLDAGAHIEVLHRPLVLLLYA